MRKTALLAAQVVVAFLLASVAGFVPGCGRGGMHATLRPNERPTVEITQAPVSPAQSSSYTCEISWAGFDTDGRVSGFRYVIDPPSAAAAETAWVSTRDNRAVFSFRSDSVVNSVAHRFHTFVVEAIDDQAARSAPAFVSFDATTLAPTVSLTNPIPSGLLAPALAPSLRIEWTGRDPDGFTTRLPVRYYWRIFGGSSTPSNDVIRTNPDTLATLFAPTFAGWDSLPGSATSVSIRGLTPGQSYVFAIVAIDEAGAWSPVFSLDQNLLQFRVDVASSVGPKVTLFNDAFRYEYPTGGIYLDPQTWAHVDFATDIPSIVQWSATTASGSFVRSARWAVDIGAIDDETARTDERSDLRHWSHWTASTTLLLPAFVPPPGSFSETHDLYLEVVDDIGLLTLVGLRMTFVRASYNRPLLVIDDTRMTADRLLATGCVDKPAGAWPSAAELDTFLYAVGGVPWKCYPTGTQSSPGILAGYDYDTLGTHFMGASDFSLNLLDRYRNILWIVDGQSAFSNGQEWYFAIQPMPYLRYLMRPGVYDPMITWIQQGGRLWLMGGGVSLASLRDFDAIGTPSNVFSLAAGELVPGRFMYNMVHWRSETETYNTARAALSSRAVGGWPGAPDYGQLPALLNAKTAASDPVPPQRTAGFFYASSFISEYVTQPNSILERAPGARSDSMYSTLDTLYETQGGISGSGYPLMTLYHGADNPPLVFSGFPLWYFQRAQGIAVADFVLQRVWGLTRRPVPR